MQNNLTITPKQNYYTKNVKKLSNVSTHKTVTFSALPKVMMQTPNISFRRPSVLENIIYSIKSLFKTKSKAYMQAEGVSQKNIDIIKKERPHVSEMMTVIHAKRLQRVEEGKSPWEEGPVDDYEQTLFLKYSKTDEYAKDRIEQIRKISLESDPHIPVQKRKLSSDELDILREQFQEGTYYFDEDDMYTFCSLIKKSTPLEKEAIVYRGISPRTLDNLRNHSFIENIKERDVITRSVHSSTAPVYDYAVDQFNANSIMCAGFTKGYIMKIHLPKGTKGLDYRGVDLFDGHQSEFILPPNSEIKVKKIDHANQIMECEYKLPDENNFLPRPEYQMNIPQRWKHDFQTIKEVEEKDYWRFEDVETLTYPHRTIKEYNKKRNMLVEYSEKIDTRTREDGATIDVITVCKEKTPATITKIIRDSNGKILFKDTIKTTS